MGRVVFKCGASSPGRIVLGASCPVMRSCSGNRAVEQGTIVTLAKRDASSLQPTYPVKHTVRVATRLSSKNLGLA